MILIRYHEKFVEENENKTITDDLIDDWANNFVETINIKECKTIMNQFREGNEILNHNQYNKDEIDMLKEIVRENDEQWNNKAHLENHRRYAIFTLTYYLNTKLGFYEF